MSHNQTSFNVGEITDYIIQLLLDDQTQKVDAINALRNFNFVIACNIWLFISDDDPDSRQWHSISLFGDSKHRISQQGDYHIDLHTYSIKHPVIRTIARIPTTMKILIHSAVDQTLDTAQFIIIGSVAIVVANIGAPIFIGGTCLHFRDRFGGFDAETAAFGCAATLMLPLWTCATIAGGALCGIGSIAAIPLHSVGTSASYLLQGRNAHDITHWRSKSAFIPRVPEIVDYIDRNYRLEKFAFKRNHTIEKRKRESSRILEKYPERIPVIVESGAEHITYQRFGEYDDHYNDVTNRYRMDKKKFLVPNDLTVGQFLYVIRKRITIEPERAVFIFVSADDKSVLPSTAALMRELYADHKDEDGFLYLCWQIENCFG